LEIDPYETTGADSGEGAFASRKGPEVCKVVVDKNSGRGWVQLVGGGKEPYSVKTGSTETGFETLDIYADQTCMIYGRSTVIYIRPRS
jgi:hypothetical protein